VSLGHPGLRRLHEVRSRFHILGGRRVLRKQQRAAPARNDVEDRDVGRSSELHGKMLRDPFSLNGRDARREVVEFTEDVRFGARTRGENARPTAGENDELYSTRTH